MEHSNLDLLNRKNKNKEFFSEHYNLAEAIELRSKYNFKNKEKQILSPKQKQFKRDMDKQFKGEVIFHATF